MITLSILSIWGFVIFNKMYKNQRINNYLLDKVSQSISNLPYNNQHYSQDKFNIDEVINEDELFGKSTDDDIISF